MKKFLVSTMAIAISALVLTGCSKNSDPYVPPTPTPTPPEPTDVEKYNAKFLEYVGGTIAPEQDWGFGASKVAAARGLTRAEDAGFVVSEEKVKQYQKDFYTELNDSLPEGRKEPGNYIKNFEFESHGPFRLNFVYSFTETQMEIGYYYYNPKVETYDKRKEVALTKQFKTDFEANAYLQYTTNSSPSLSQWELYKSNMGAYIWDSYSAKLVQGHMITLKIEGNVDVPEGYYVGFYTKIDGEKYYTNRYLNKNESNTSFVVIDSNNDKSLLKNVFLVGIEDRMTYEGIPADIDCNDVILDVYKHIDKGCPTLVIPEKKKNPVFRIIGEDISAEKSSDFDFNDIVLDVQLTDKGAKCWLQAAGGQLPVRINRDDNFETHKLFKVDLNTMVNTNAPAKGLPGKDGLPPVEFTIEGKFSSVLDVPIQVYKNNQWIDFFAEKGKSACKILVDDPNFKWPDERESLNQKYTKFNDWVKDPSVKWY